MSSEIGTGARGLALQVEGISKCYRIGNTQGLYRYRSLRDDLIGGVRRRLTRSAPEQDSALWALRDVSFSVGEGERVGVIGENGAGKSTLFKVLSRVTPPTRGRATIHGRLGSLLEVGTGFHPELTGRENIFLAGAVLGMRRSEIASRLHDIIEFAGVSKFLDTPVKRFSSGMYMRLAFAVAAHLEPEILLVDEVLSVGDADFQKKCLGKISDIGTSGRTVLFVSHSMPAVLRICSRVILLRRGQVIADGPPSEVVRVYLESGHGTRATREWSEPLQAPGDDIARLKAVRVRDEAGIISEEVDIRRPFSIEVEYWNLGADADDPLTANIHFHNADGVHLFVSADFNDPEWKETPRIPGVVSATCHIPGNFLAEGTFYASVYVTSLRPIHVHGGEANAVAFQVVDRSQGDGARGEVAFDWPGVIRPLLRWTVHQEPHRVLAAQRQSNREVATHG